MNDIRKVEEISLSRLEKAGFVVMTNKYNSESERGRKARKSKVSRQVKKAAARCARSRSAVSPLHSLTKSQSLTTFAFLLLQEGECIAQSLNVTARLHFS